MAFKRWVGVWALASAMACGDDPVVADTGADGESESSDDGGSEVSDETTETTEVDTGDGDGDGDTGDGDGDGDGDCAWPTIPTRLDTPDLGSLSWNLNGGDALYGRWLGGGAAPTGTAITRTDWNTLQTEVIWTGTPMQTLAGVSDSELFVTTQNIDPLLLEIIVLDHDGQVVRTAPATSLGASPFDVVAANHAYVAVGSEILMEDAGAFTPTGLSGGFTGFRTAPNAMILDGLSLCVLDDADPANVGGNPCMTLPTQIEGATWWGLSYSDHRHDRFAGAFLTDAGYVVAIEDAGDFVVIDQTDSLWSLNGLDATPDGWAWLRQRSVTLNDFETEFVYTLGSDPTLPEGAPVDGWTITGQAHGLVATPCGHAFALTSAGDASGLYVVGYP